MNINWRLKSAIFRAIDLFDLPAFLYFIQKNVMKRSRVIKLSADWKQHQYFLEKYNTVGFIFEFGAGKTLAQNLFLSKVVDQQLLVDLNPMLDLELVEMARNSLSTMIALKTNTKIVEEEDLEKYGIRYKAPADASKSELPDRIVDACISTNTLEHIPKEKILKIFHELHRILKDSGIVSAKIDYSDHYAHTDKNISLLNYLKYSEREWQKYNHSSHHQNRLRHYDYIAIFQSTGFELVEETLTFAEHNIPSQISTQFSGKDENWKATSAHVVLRKA